MYFNMIFLILINAFIKISALYASRQISKRVRKIGLLQDKGLHLGILAYNYRYTSFNKHLTLSEELGIIVG